MLKVEYTSRFKKDMERAKKRGYDMNRLREVISMLSNEQRLPAKYCDHALTESKQYKNMRECHIAPDWLLVYKIEGDILLLTLFRTGTHSDLF